MDYETISQGAATWGLLYLFIVFVIVVIYTFRPGSKKKYDAAANIPFREDD